MLVKDVIGLSGRLVISDDKGRVVFEDNNKLCDEGMMGIINWLGSGGGGEVASIMLLNNEDVPTGEEEFSSEVTVGGTLLKEGVLHSSNLTVTIDDLVLQVEGELVTGACNDSTGTPPGNVIHSACLVMDSDSSGGLGDGSGGVYNVLGTEKLLSKISVDTIVKENSKAYTFTWTITMSAVV